MPHRTARSPWPLLCAVSATALAGAMTSLPAAAQSSPYYVGIAQTFSHESNLLRLRKGQVAPPGLSESDTISSTALVAGIDQRFGRQRLNGSATVRDNRYANNEQFNGQSYNGTLSLDWETIERLRGNVTVGADRTQRADLRTINGLFIPNGTSEMRNRFAASVSLGLAGPLSLEGGVSAQSTRYSAAQAEYANNSDTSVSAGVRYRLGGATSVSLGLRHTQTELPNLLIFQADPRDKRKRNDVDLGLVWAPTGTSRLDARFSQGRTTHEQIPSRDFSGSSGAVSWSWAPGGKLRLNGRLARDIGQASQFVNNASAFSQTVDSVRLAADYELTGKISLNTSLQSYRRNLERLGLSPDPQTGSDTTNIFALGARWAVLRSASLGCQASAEQRGSNSNLLLDQPYSSNSFSCFGQLLLQ